MNFKFLAACRRSSSPAAPADRSAADAASTAPGATSSTDMDSAVKPGDDFFDYVERHLGQDHAIAADRPVAGINYELTDEIEQRRPADRRGRRPRTRPSADRPADRRSLCQLDGRGRRSRRAALAPLKPYLDQIDAVKNRGELVDLFAEPGYAAPIDLGIFADQDDPTRYTAFAGQARPRHAEPRLLSAARATSTTRIRKAYRDYIVELGKLAGLSDRRRPRPTASSRSRRALAKDQWTPERRRDIDKIYNPMTRAQLLKLAPQFDWTATLAKAGLGNGEDGRSSPRRARSPAPASCSPTCRWHLEGISRPSTSSATTPNFLPKAFDDAQLRFLSQDAARRSAAARPLEARRATASTAALGEGGRPDLRRSAIIRPRATARCDELIGDIRAALSREDRAATAGWTTRPARRRWTSSPPSIRASATRSSISTIRRCKVEPRRPARQRHRAERVRVEAAAQALPQAGRPHAVGHAAADRSTPITTRRMNQITFPAAILQPPFSIPNADPAVNYGEIGATHRPRDRATASTTRAASSTPRAAARLVDPGDAAKPTRRRPTRWSRSTTATSRSPACTSRAS